MGGEGMDLSGMFSGTVYKRESLGVSKRLAGYA